MKTGELYNRQKKQYMYEDRIITEGTIIVPEMKNCSIPLKSTELKAHIKGIIADVEVLQKFYNDLDRKIEAVYVFPLSHDSSVNFLEIKVGERIITGEIKEREEARQVYNEAKQDGRKAALLEEERPNLFTMSVTGIEPAQEILVKLRYYETIKYEDSEYEFVFPMTITPRYISPEVTDEERITPPVKEPDKNNKRDVHISVNLDAGFEVGNIYSPTHKLHIEEKDKSVKKIELQREGELPDKDFVLKYASRGEKMESTLTFYREKDRAGTFMLNVTPKFDYGPGEIVKRELLFVLDRSGSMRIAMKYAKDALKKALRTMRSGDLFNIIAFDDRLDILSERSLELNEVNFMLADNFINSTSARGGTHILPAMKRALDIPSSKSHLRQIVFITDGAVGNEDFVFVEIEKNMKRSRIFTFGIGSSVNRYLLEKMAKAGRGNSYFITDPKEIGETIERFTIQTSTPVLSDITLEWKGVSVSDTYPSPLPDLYLGQVLKVFGRFHSSGKGKAILKCSTGEGKFKEELDVELPETDTSHPAIETIWAKHRIENLLDRQRENPKEKFSLRDEILGLALKYKIITPYTSLVAVEKDDGNREDKREEVITVKVPLLPPEPAGFKEGVVYLMMPPVTAKQQGISKSGGRFEANLGCDVSCGGRKGFWDRVSDNAGFISSMGEFLVPDPGAQIAARYTLDAMPGKQMAIDADVSSGLVTPDEARRRRREEEEEFNRELMKARGRVYYVRFFFFFPFLIILYLLTIIFTGATEIIKTLFNKIRGIFTT